MRNEKINNDDEWWGRNLNIGYEITYFHIYFSSFVPNLKRGKLTIDLTKYWDEYYCNLDL